jgi:DNA primase
MGNQWVSFDQIKQTPGVMRKVLEFYGLVDDMKERGSQLTGICPIHKGSNRTEFSVHLQKSIWQCFSCKAKGDVINFVELMEGVDRREAALKIASWLGIAATGGRESKKLVREEKKVDGKEEKKDDCLYEKKEEKDRADHAAEPAESKGEQKSDPVNPPLKFQLQNLDADHPYLQARVLPETIRHFGLGLCKKGMMNGRVVIPIHNDKGELIAYAGRWPGGDPPEGEGKYKLPPKFQKSHVVFNLHRAIEANKGTETKELILTEGYFDVFSFFERGVNTAVALMGSSLSQEQERLILEAAGSEGKVLLAFDDDEAGHLCTQDVIKRLIKKVFVKSIL